MSTARALTGVIATHLAMIAASGSWTGNSILTRCRGIVLKSYSQYEPLALNFWRQIGDELATKWRQIGDKLATKWRQIGDKLATKWRQIGDGRSQLMYINCGIRQHLTDVSV